MEIMTRGTCEAMVFRPTAKQFKNFSNYVHYMEQMGAHEAGIAKVIPPDGWRPNKYKDYIKAVENLVIPHPLSQTVCGLDGIYQQYSKGKKPLIVKDFMQLAESEYATPEHSTNEELDQIYWSSVTDNDRIYGADISDSLFQKNVKSWNLRSLNTILDRVSNDYGLKIEGVNTTYLYFGMWKTSFPWHTEDCDLYSINYHHFGKRKVWYTIPPAYGKRFEELVRKLFPANYQACEGFLRHKTTIISPDVLNFYSIPYNKVDQNPGEFIITFPFGYHAGYNAGFNCAEAINFASLRWIDYGKKATKCTCKLENINISMDTFVKTYQSDQYEKWINGKDFKKHPEEDRKLELSRPAPGPKISLTFIKKDGIISIENKRKSDQSYQIHKKRKLESPTVILEACDKKMEQLETNNYSPEKSVGNDSWLDKYVMFTELCKQNIRVDKIMEKWAIPLNLLWTKMDRNFDVEIAFNVENSLTKPHCAICSLFPSFDDIPKTSEIPAKSIPRISDVYFTNGDYTTEEIQSSLLLTCSSCKVCVHASCYTVSQSSIINEQWLCQRCISDNKSVECMLCNLRGGAFKEVSNGLWVHVVCAIVTWNRCFSPDSKVLLGYNHSESRSCSFCQGLSCHLDNYLSGVFTVQCDEIDCDQSFHVTCAAAAGVHFTISKDFPFTITKTCLKHKDVIESAMQRVKDTSLSVSLGDTVTAKNRNRRYYNGTVINIETKIVLKVEVDTSRSIENVDVRDVIRDQFFRNESFIPNEKIHFKMLNQIKSGIYKGQVSSSRYKILFEDYSFVWISRSEFFVKGQEVPAKVAAKISYATPMKYKTEDN